MMNNKTSNVFVIPLYLLLMTKSIFSVSSITTTTSTETISNLQEDVNTLKYTTKLLADQLEKWNNLFLTSLEPRLSSIASSLASVNSNVQNLQERAHVWDTFQLHVSAWNDQLATLDRKVDIISKGQETVIIAQDSKNNFFNSVDYKLNDAIGKVESVQEAISNLKEESQKHYDHKDHDLLFGEFAARGILSTIKMVEKKLDRLLLTQQNSLSKFGEEDCYAPRLNDEELLNDISSKVDVIFDKINDKEDRINERDNENYFDGSGDMLVETPFEMRINPDDRFIKKITKKINKPFKKFNQPIEELIQRTIRIENISRIILDKEDVNTEATEKLFDGDTNSTFLMKILNKIEEVGAEFNEKFNGILESYFNEQKAHFESLVFKQINNYKAYIQNLNQRIPKQSTTISTSIILEKNKSGCEDLDPDSKSGVYIFGNDLELNSKSRSYEEKYCLIRNDGPWTVIQRRDIYSSPQNFNLSWFHYKNGFGDLARDFWFGNDFISKFSNAKELMLRIELEDFDGNSAWAEYLNFVLLPERENYKMIVGTYMGNASDCFTSHNNSKFSTFDKRNDQAPECCPCAVSFGSGWWFNACFESNLNGVYHINPRNNGYFKGIIWKHWLGNYSLKKTVMMVKPFHKLEKRK